MCYYISSRFLVGVLHVSYLGNLTYEEAENYCHDQNATLASTAALYAAWNEGFHNCDPGWLSDGSVRYSVRDLSCGVNRTGVYTIYANPDQTGFPDPFSRYDAYCIKGTKCRSHQYKNVRQGNRSTLNTL